LITTPVLTGFASSPSGWFPGYPFPRSAIVSANFSIPSFVTLLRKSAARAGCWIVGFGRGEDVPEHVEIFWKWEGSEFVVRETTGGPPNILLGGSGSIGLHADVGRIESASVDTVRAMHAELYERAMKSPDKPPVVGGHIHELLLTPQRWEWTMPPPGIAQQ